MREFLLVPVVGRQEDLYTAEIFVTWKGQLNEKSVFTGAVGRRETEADAIADAKAKLADIVMAKIDNGEMEKNDSWLHLDYGETVRKKV